MVDPLRFPEAEWHLHPKLNFGWDDRATRCGMENLRIETISKGRHPLSPDHLERTILESLPQLVWVTDATGTPLHFSRSWLDYTGLKEGEGEWWKGSVHPDDSPSTVQQWR
ncbi:MAG TPA: PAS domain-containing protein, partial [Chthonomonadales bacterium]|nr:PAS domain-containing protein [Chthonomonadales bacterium]